MRGEVVTVSSFSDQSDKIEWHRTDVRLFVLLIFVAFLIPRLFLLAFASGLPTDDGQWYFERAISIVSGHGYAFDGKITALWPIGYPGFLALLFLFFPESALTGLIANFFLSAATVICSYYIFRRLRVGTFWPLFGCLGLTLYPTFILYQQMLWSEILTTTLITAAILGLLISRNNLHYFLTGIVFGLATLVKSQTLLYLIFVPLYDVAAKRTVWGCAGKYVILLIGVALTVSPWTLRNFIEFDRFILVQSNGCYALFQGNNPINGYGTAINSDAFAAAYPEVVSDITKPLPDEINMSDRACSAALKFMMENPLEVLRRIPNKLYRFFGHDALVFMAVSKSNARVSRPLPWLMSFFEISFWYHMVTVALAMLSSIFFLAGPDRTKAHYLLLCAVGSFASISVIFFGLERYAIPVIPAFVGCALVSLYNFEIRFYRPFVRSLRAFWRQTRN
jgi:hypothetical protein